MIGIFGIIVVFFIVVRLADEFVMESFHEEVRSMMEQDKIVTPLRQNVIQGIFRQHNQAFRQHGFKPPEGNA
jgi:hypothetical protein